MKGITLDEVKKLPETKGIQQKDMKFIHKLLNYDERLLFKILDFGINGYKILILWDSKVLNGLECTGLFVNDNWTYQLHQDKKVVIDVFSEKAFFEKLVAHFTNLEKIKGAN